MEFLSNLRGPSVVLEAVELEYSFPEDRGDDDDAEDEDEDDLEMWKEVFGLPPPLRDAPTLTFFRVSKLPFSDCFLELHHLTHLELSLTAAWSRDYLAIMTANPMLEVVILRGMADAEEGEHNMETTVISLPRLRRLELYQALADQILRGFTFPPGTHLSCICTNGYIIPRSDGLLNVSTVEKLQFAFSRHRGRVSRVVSGFGPNGTFLLSDANHQLGLYVPEIPPGSLEELSVTFADVGTGEGCPSLAFVDIHGYFLGSIFSTFTSLRVLILRRVHGCEVILRLLCNPRICPNLNAVVLANAQSHTTYWSSLVEMARVREQHMGSNNVHRVDVGCRAEELPEPEQLAELRAYVFSVELKPWNYEVEELNWLNDSRYRKLGRL